MVLRFLFQPFKQRFLRAIDERSTQAYNAWMAIVASALIAVCYKLSFFDFCVLTFFVNLIPNIPMLLLTVNILVLMGSVFILTFVKHFVRFVRGNRV